MSAPTRPTFETKDRQKIYDYVEAKGPIRSEDLHDAGVVSVDPDRYRQLIAVMKRDGYLEERNGRLRASLPPGVEEEHSGAEFEFKVRPARQTDISGVVGVIRQVTSHGEYILAESVAQQLSGDDLLVDPESSDSEQLFVATVDDEVVGWAHLARPAQEKLAHTAELTVGVLDEYRGQDIGSHLMQRGLAAANAIGLHKVYNSVPATNEGAIEFLERHDWAVETIREDHYYIDGEFVDEVMLAVTLE